MERESKDMMTKSKICNKNRKRNRSEFQDYETLEREDLKRGKSGGSVETGGTGGSGTTMTLLPHHFVPSHADVLCARGKAAYNHSGNQRYRALIESHLQKYSEASSKLEKSHVVSAIVEIVRQASPGGGFVKYEDGRWYEVGDAWAREKVGQSLRDLLHTKYKSSTRAKRDRRRVVNAQLNDDVNKFMQSTICQEVSGKIRQLAEKAKNEVSENRILQLFNQANEELLEMLKKNTLKQQQKVDETSPHNQDSSAACSGGEGVPSSRSSVGSDPTTSSRSSPTLFDDTKGTAKPSRTCVGINEESPNVDNKCETYQYKSSNAATFASSAIETCAYNNSKP